MEKRAERRFRASHTRGKMNRQIYPCIVGLQVAYFFGCLLQKIFRPDTKSVYHIYERLKTGTGDRLYTGVYDDVFVEGSGDSARGLQFILNFRFSINAAPRHNRFKFSLDRFCARLAVYFTSDINWSKKSSSSLSTFSQKLSSK